MERAEIQNSEVGILLEVQNKYHLLVSFGGIQQGLGIPIFEFYNSISNINCDKIFIRDFNQSWYQKGVDGEITSSGELKNYLDEFIANGKYKKVSFLGNSMGGFGAILYGTMLNVDNVIAFAPQTFVDRWNRFKNRDNRWRNQISNIYKFKNINIKHLDLKRHLKNVKYNTNINIYYSLTDRLDKVHAERLVNLENVNLYSIEKGGHNVVKIIRDNGDLQGIIESTFTD